ncbi:MAG TPA: sigma-70 family RNA polymerase sigma factor [Alphaproteobacteria bacterium]|nr:sigma-70 family RNA polymerase sigma factor [Alphaproteobacteria bacterium]
MTSLPLPDRESWGRLMAEAQAGEQASYQRLLAALLPYLRGYARRHLRGEAAEDLVQDVLLTVHRIRQTYDPARPFLPWLSVIAKRRMIDMLRRQKLVPASADDLGLDIETFADPAANNQVERTSEAERLRQAIAELPEGQRQALQLLKLEEKSLKEASDITGMSVPALKTATHRAIKALRGKLFGPESREGETR